MARGSTLATIVVVHASIIFALVTHMLTVHSGNIPEAILVTVVDKPLRPPEDLLPKVEMESVDSCYFA